MEKTEKPQNIASAALTRLLGLPVEAVRQTLLGRIQVLNQEIVLPCFGKFSGENGGVRKKPDMSLITDADTQMQDALIESLHASWPSIPVLGEELPRKEQQALLSACDKAVWVLDPIDGTSNFAAGIPYFCTSLALVADGRVVMGMVYDPNRDECFFACENGPATLNNQLLQSERDAPGVLADCMG